MEAVLTSEDERAGRSEERVGHDHTVSATQNTQEQPTRPRAPLSPARRGSDLRAAAEPPGRGSRLSNDDVRIKVGEFCSRLSNVKESHSREPPVLFFFIIRFLKYV